jgi:hypothetical protein
MYSAALNVGSHTAQIDYFELLAASGKPLLLHGFELGQTTEVGDAAEEMLLLLLKRVTGAPTSGSGGPASPTLAPLCPNDTAAGATLEHGNTTKLSGGTQTELARFSWNIRSPLLWLPPPEGRITLDAGTRIVLEELTTPADAVTGPVGWVLVEELV